jgi:hypothetical protein
MMFRRRYVSFSNPSSRGWSFRVAITGLMWCRRSHRRTGR